jgi:hypothetical protein
MRFLWTVPFLTLGMALGQVRPAAVVDQPLAQALRAENQLPVFAARDVLFWARTGQLRK